MPPSMETLPRNIQVTSTDGLGAIGRGEGIAAQAVVLLHAAGDGA